MLDRHDLHFPSDHPDLQTPAPSNSIRRLWDRLSPLPGGATLFSFLIGRKAPYTGTIRPRVRKLREGYACVAMTDRRPVRNHLDSIHAVALLNLAEVTSGLALHYGLPNHARAILTGLEIEYLKKARGHLVAEARAPVPAATEREELTLICEVFDASGDAVARARAAWLVGPRAEAGRPA
ncbi:MAG: hotdog fold domain-containing protein [Gemmatimonadota bacterium]